jgi:type VI secretion system protein VasG
VPPTLRDARLLSLDVGALLAGASMRGEFESRLKSLLDEAAHSVQPVILFVDEVHTLIGAGGQAGTGDAANLLKPALARGTLRTVGATTWSEYKRHIEKDPALTRRFQTLQVAEPDEAAAVEMVRGLVGTFASHHGVTVLDEAVRPPSRCPIATFPRDSSPTRPSACSTRPALAWPCRCTRRRRRSSGSERRRQPCRSNSTCLVRSDGRAGARCPIERHRRSAGKAGRHCRRACAQETKWNDELAAVQQIHALRVSEGASEEEAGCAGGASPSAQLIALEQALRSRQQEAPLIFPQVDEQVVAAIVADWTGIPVGRMVQDEVAAVLSLQARLDARVIGQGHAIAAIAERVQVARARLSDPDKPVGVFLLVGPSGVGKTETALALAEAMYGGEQNLITINMSEFQEPHTVSTLKGAPPGYVGYGEGGVMTEAVRRRPYSVILLDEVEKAHPDVHEIFYQVFDKGWMEDGEGRHIDFRNTTILLTSNTGSELIANLCDGAEGVPAVDVFRERLHPVLRTVFPAAFLGRLVVVPYLPLAAHALENIVLLHLGRVVERMSAQHGIALTCTPALVADIVERCGTHETGARRPIGFIEQRLLPLLSRQWLDALRERRTIARMSVDVQARSNDSQDFEGGDAIVCRTEYA